MHGKLLLTGILGLVLIVSVSAETVNLGDPANPASMTVLESNSEKILIRLDLGAFESNIVDIDGQPYSAYKCGDESIYRERGNPALPKICRSLIIPDDAHMIVNIIDAEYIEYKDVLAAPSKGSILRNVDPRLVKYEFSDVYNQDSYFPGSLAQLSEPFIQRDYRGVVLEAHPFQYNPISKTLRVYRTLIVEVVNSGPGQVNVLKHDKKKSARIADFESIYRHRFINYDFQSKLYPDVPETGDMLIITYDAFNSDMTPFVNWKQQKGIKTTIINVSSIGNNYTAIGNFIDAYYDSTDLAWVLLVGDAAQVATGSFNGGGADPMYAQIVGSDSYPEVFIGRFSAENSAHVQTQVARTIAYERDHPGTGWYTRATGIASDEGPGHFGEWDATHMNYIRDDLLAYNFTLVDQIYDPGATPAQVAAAVNNGRSLMNYVGHGSTYSWSSSGFSTTNINALTNTGMLPVINSVACVNGNFTGATCFGEAWLRATYSNEPTGAVGAYMSSINQYWDEPMYGQDEYNDLMCAEAKTTFGGLCFHSSSYMIEQNGQSGIDMYNTWHIFGDPSIQVRTLDPQPVTVNHAGAMFFVASEYEVEVVGVEGALCAIYYDGILYGSAYTASDGTATIPIGQDLPIAADVYLTITGYNIETVVETVTTTSDLAIVHRNPLSDTKDTLNDYRVDCEIYTSAPLNENELLLKYEINSVQTDVVLSEGSMQGEYYGMIPAQPAGTEISYYLYATNTGGYIDSTDMFSFNVIDYGLMLDPAMASQSAPVYDTVTYDFTITNDGVLEDAYDISIGNNQWPTAILDATGMYEIASTSSLYGDETFDFKIRVIVPESWEDEYDSTVVTVTSQGDGNFSETAFVKTVSAGQPWPIPFSDDFPSATLDVNKWESTDGVETSILAVGIPSPPYVLNFDGHPSGGDELVSEKINLKNESGCILRFSYERTANGDSPEAGDDLVAEIMDAVGVWHEVVRLPGEGPDMLEFEKVEISLPAEAYHAEFRFRLSNSASSGSFDDWFVDDVYVGYPPDYELIVSPFSQSQYGASGSDLVYQITIVNRGRLDDIYDLSPDENTWGVSFFDESGLTAITSTPLIAAEDSITVTAKVAIPEAAAMHDLDDAKLVATSQGDPNVFYTVNIESISAGPAGTFPWSETFPDVNIAAPRWLTNIGAAVSESCLNPPSSPYALNLDGGGDTVVSQIIDLSGAGGATIAYYYQCGGGGATPGSGDDLSIDYKNEYGNWVNLGIHEGDGTNMNTFERVSTGLPADAVHANFQLRLISSGTGEGLDDWFVDNIRVDYAPSMAVSPSDNMNISVMIGEETSETLTISNAGPGTLEYNVKTVPVLNRSLNYDHLNALGEVEPARREYTEEFLSYEDPKGVDDPRQGYPVTRNAGGADLFGYYWVDSDEPTGPTFNWIDISATGTDVTAGLDDDNYIGPFDLGFDFPYYGQTFTQFYIGSNGMIGFYPDGMNVRHKKSIPNDSIPNGMICWLWDDLNPTDTDVPDVKVYYGGDSEQCVIMFDNYPEYGAAAGETITAEVILKPDGSIIVQYLEIGSGFDIGSATIGIESPDGTDGLEVAYLTEYIHENLALQYYCPAQWLTLEITEGVIAPGGADDIICNVASGTMEEGVYLCDINISSNDPDPGKASYSVRAQLTVSAEPQYICGDANDDTEVNLIDILLLIDVVYNGSTESYNAEASDVDGSNMLDLVDILSIIDFVYNEGPILQCP